MYKFYRNTLSDPSVVHERISDMLSDGVSEEDIIMYTLEFLSNGIVKDYIRFNKALDTFIQEQFMPGER